MTTVTAPKATSNGTAAEKAVASKLNLWQRIVAVQSEVSSIPKSGTAPAAMGGFKFVRDVDVYDAARKLFATHGIAYSVSMPHHTTEHVGSTSTGKPIYRSTVDVEIRLRNMDDPSEVEIIQWAGEGDDGSDKSLSKAGTSCIKYALCKALLIGGDPAVDPDQSGTEHGAGSTAPGHQGGELGGKRPPACPTCAELGIESKMWPAKKGPRVGDLQCNGRDAGGAYLNHYLPDANSTPAAAKVTVKERVPVGRGCPEATCDGDLEAITWSSGQSRIGCTNWRDKDGGCRYKENVESVPPEGLTPVDSTDSIPF